jgi:hypothetical protein
MTATHTLNRSIVMDMTTLRVPPSLLAQTRITISAALTIYHINQASAQALHARIDGGFLEKLKAVLEDKGDRPLEAIDLLEPIGTCLAEMGHAVSLYYQANPFALVVMAWMIGELLHLRHQAHKLRRKPGSIVPLDMSASKRKC